MSETHQELTFTYSISHKIVFVFLFSILLLFSATALTPFIHIFFDKGFIVTSIIFLMILLIVLIVTISQILILLRTRLIISNHQIIFRQIFKIQVLRFEYIQYYQHYFTGKKRVLYVVDKDNRKIKIDSYLMNFEIIEKFISRNFKNFDQIRGTEDDFLLEVMHLPENKKIIKIKSYLDISLTFCCLSLLVYPNSFIHLIVQFYVFTYMMTLILVYKSLNSNQIKGFVNTICVILVLLNIIYISDYINLTVILSNNTYFVYALCCFVLLFFCFLFCSFLSIRSIKKILFLSSVSKRISLFLFVIGLALIVIFPSLGLVQTLNSVGDNKVIAIEKYIILDKARVGKARREIIFLEGQSVNKNIKISVTNEQYSKLKLGEVYELHIRQGNLGINWAKIY